MENYEQKVKKIYPDAVVYSNGSIWCVWGANSTLAASGLSAENAWHKAYCALPQKDTHIDKSDDFKGFM